MPQIGPVELAIIVIIALIVVGPGKLPEVGSALGRSIREFRKAATDVKDSTRLEPLPESTQAVTTATATPTPATPIVAPAPIPPAPAEPAEPAEPAGEEPATTGSTTETAGR